MTSRSARQPGAAVADLHSHTTASDGLRSPAQLVAEAKAAGLSALGLTDHDTIDGIAEATEAAGPELQVVPGIELSATAGSSQAHILGYFVDIASPTLLAALADFQRMRIERTVRFAARLTELGLPITVGEVVAMAGGGSVGRPHIARVMIARGYVDSVRDAFDSYLAYGRPAYVARDDISPEACIELIVASGGVAVLAHPFSTGDPEGFAIRLKAAGLAGIEVEYGSYDEERRGTLRAIAARHDLIPTGGSDYHGSEHREHNRLGDGQVPMATVTALSQLAGR